MSYISIDEFKKGEIKIGKILSAEEIEGSDKLLKLSVDFGEDDSRQVLSGIKKYFENPEELVGIKCAFATNLEPRKMMGMESQAMLLAASTEEGKLSVLRVSDDIPEGSSIN